MLFIKHFLGEINTQIFLLVRNIATPTPSRQSCEPLIQSHSYSITAQFTKLCIHVRFEVDSMKFLHSCPSTKLPLYNIPLWYGSDRKFILCLMKMTEIFSYTAGRQLSQMFFAVFFFHMSEYILAIAFHGSQNVTLRSLLISKNYILAMLFSLMEYIVEIVFFPGSKEYWWISNVGLVMVIVGEIIRKSAIITAGRAFTHIIRVYHEEHHELITQGVYGFVRHPSYCGFLIWSVGTQIMLCNPMSTIGFAFVVWGFFAERIPYEEYFLKEFFGIQYEEYARRVPSGVPFVK